MIKKIQEKLNIQTVIRMVPAILFLLFIFYFLIRTFTGDVKAAVMNTDFSLESLGELSDSFEKTLQDGIYGKNEYINLNGLTARALGINSLNNRIKLENGYLADFEGVKDISNSADNLVVLNNFLYDRGIPFLYILVPSKASYYNVQFPPGYDDNDARQNIDDLTRILNENNVWNLNLNKWFEQNGWQMEDTFFITDHHWLPETAFVTARYTMETLSENGFMTYDAELFDRSNWTITVLKDWFLGSDGKRTGLAYAGVDDISVFVPNFETDYNYSYLRRNSSDWVYRNTALDLNYTKQKDYFGADVFDGIYIGDYPLKNIVNSEAESDKRVLILGDSFRNPFQYFLSTQFKEIYTVDLRYYTDGSLAQYISEIKPDIVLMCSYEENLTYKELYAFGVTEYLNALRETDPVSPIISLGDISVKPKDEDMDNFEIICRDLEPDQTYTLTLDSILYDGGEDQYVQMTLQDHSTDKAIYNRYFDANSDEIQRWIFTTPKDISDEYCIYLYAGTKGHTQNVNVKISDIILRKGLFED